MKSLPEPRLNNIMRKSFAAILVLLAFFALPLFASDVKVVALSPAVTEIIYDLGCEESLIGVSDYSNWPPDACKKEHVGSFLNPSVEKIVALMPDYVIVNKNGGTLPLKKKLDAIGIDTVVVQFYSVKDIEDAYLKIGDILGAKKAALKKVADMEKKVSYYRGIFFAKEKKRVLFVRWYSPFTVAGKGSLEDELISIAGGKNVIDFDSSSRYPVCNMEYIIEKNPEVIIDGSVAGQVSGTKINDVKKFWEKYGVIAAVKKNRIYVLSGSYHVVPGPRTFILLKEVFSSINPEIGIKSDDLLNKNVKIK